MRFFSRRDPERNYLNKAIIGLGVGLVRSKDLVLSSDFGPQGVMDILAVWIGQEIVKELIAQKKIKLGASERELIEKLLAEVRMAENLHVEFSDSTASVTIQNCLICPKRVGGYDLGQDTACPVGGILLGALKYFHGESPATPQIDLSPAQICRLKFNIKLKV
ncbi:MAG: hypothetical protein ACFFCZ_21115 [Promethearchaeota archaeon]